MLDVFKFHRILIKIQNIMSTKKLSKKTQSYATSGIVMGNSFYKLANECKQYVTCDTVRISKPLEYGEMFLIIGFNRNTKEDVGQWTNQDGELIDFDYVQESCIAAGKTKDELIDSAKEYERLCGITWEEYFNEL